MQYLKIITLGLVVGLMGLTAACDNTIRGVGRDIQDTGEALEDATE